MDDYATFVKDRMDRGSGFIVRLKGCVRDQKRTLRTYYPPYYVFYIEHLGLPACIALTPSDFSIYATKCEDQDPNYKELHMAHMENDRLSFLTHFLGVMYEIKITKHMFSKKLVNRGNMVSDRIELYLNDEAFCTTILTYTEKSMSVLNKSILEFVEYNSREIIYCEASENLPDFDNGYYIESTTPISKMKMCMHIIESSIRK